MEEMRKLCFDFKFDGYLGKGIESGDFCSWIKGKPCHIYEKLVSIVQGSIQSLKSIETK